jgi:hypothetical protein
MCRSREESFPWNRVRGSRNRQYNPSYSRSSRRPPSGVRSGCVIGDVRDNVSPRWGAGDSRRSRWVKGE